MNFMFSWQEQYLTRALRSLNIFAYLVPDVSLSALNTSGGTPWCLSWKTKSSPS